GTAASKLNQTPVPGQPERHGSQPADRGRRRPNAVPGARGSALTGSTYPRRLPVRSGSTACVRWTSEGERQPPGRPIRHSRSHGSLRWPPTIP
ncbi:MAG: hypothetical protein ACK55I_41080, partial [bacterium]